MESNSELIKIEKYSHYRRYLLIIGILVLAFSLSLTMRSAPLEWGFELNEFDPFFNYRATQFVVDNGLPAYLEWNDDLSWHPYGRDVSATSQVMLHVTGATLYQIFGMGTSLYDFTIWFPAVIGSLTTVVIFALVRTIGGTTAGLLASLFFAVSPIIIIRGALGWYKSEPLGFFFGLLAVYLLISGIKSDKGRISLAKVVGGGILLALGLSSWGGVQFFVLPIGIFFLALPFLRKDNKFIIWASVIFTTVFFLVTISFERTGIPFISSLSGFFLIGCTVFLVAATLIKRIGNKTQLRNISALLGGAIIAGIAIVSSGAINLPAFRYLNAANPFLIAESMLVDSVSEHATTTIGMSFFFLSILMIFAGIGAWFLFQKKINRSWKIEPHMAAFALIIGFLGIYFSSAFARLEVLGSISVIILSSIGVSILISRISSGGQRPTNSIAKIASLAVIGILLTVPLFYPLDHNWSNDQIERPISILHSGSHFDISTNDWAASMQWLKENSPKDSVIAAWWDYGYWISTLSERKTVADNSTLLDWQIKKVATTYMSTPNDAWKILSSDAETDVSQHFVSFPISDSQATNLEERKLELFTEWRIGDYNGNGIINEEELDGWYEGGRMCQPADWQCAKWEVNPGKISQYSTLFDYWETEVYTTEPILTGLDADYIIVNLAVRQLPDANAFPVFVISQQGGDETKTFWFMKIADLNTRDYIQRGSDGKMKGYTDKFWNETLLGKLIPFTVLTYVDPDNPELQSDTFKLDYVPIYVRDIKFPSWENVLDEKSPFQLVYAPPSFKNGEPGPLTGPLIYKINKDYNPNQ